MRSNESYRSTTPPPARTPIACSCCAVRVSTKGTRICTVPHVHIESYASPHPPPSSNYHHAIWLNQLQPIHTEDDWMESAPFSSRSVSPCRVRWTTQSPLHDWGNWLIFGYHRRRASSPVACKCAARTNCSRSSDTYQKSSLQALVCPLQMYHGSCWDVTYPTARYYS